ncbi:MAG: 3-keto-disaccharide hydrolase [Thermoguttaceae bacterium]
MKASSTGRASLAAQTGKAGLPADLSGIMLGMVLACAAVVGHAFAAEPSKAQAKKPEPEKQADKTQWRDLFDGKTLKNWKVPEFGGEGRVYVKDGTIIMERGDMMTGVTYTGPLPKINYEISLEGMRVEGNDFFCTTTFPVGDSFLSFVVGGWGGPVVGISSIDYYDASDNQTTRIKDFKTKQWYKVRIRVSQEKVEAWIDDEKMVDFQTKGHKLSIRFECDLCRPLGIATYQTTGAVRNIRLRELSPEEVAKLREETTKDP